MRVRRNYLVESNDSRNDLEKQWFMNILKNVKLPSGWEWRVGLQNLDSSIEFGESEDIERATRLLNSAEKIYDLAGDLADEIARFKRI